MKIKMLLMILLSAAVLLSLVGTSQAETEITGCTEITEPGDYVLTTDIATTAETCFSIEADDVTFDCDGYTIDGDDAGSYEQTFGFYAFNRDNLTIKNCVVSDFTWGIYFDADSQSGHVISNNVLQSNDVGLFLNKASGCIVSNVDVISNTYIGIFLNGASENFGNMLYYNNFISNTNQASDDTIIGNDWHHTTLLEGNYWSDYTGADDGSGGRTAGDSIGDTLIPHPGEGYDEYPLMERIPRVDQSFTDTDYARVGGLDKTFFTRQVAQSFTPQVEDLDQVSLYLESTSDGEYTAIVEIQTDTNGKPSGELVGEDAYAEVAFSDIPEDSDWIDVPLSAELTKGDKYWIVVRDNTNSMQEYIGWAYAPVYSRGSEGYVYGEAAFHRGVGSWMCIFNADRFFETWGY